MAHKNPTPRLVYAPGFLFVVDGVAIAKASGACEVFPTPLECQQYIEEQGYNDSRFRAVVIALKVVVRS